MAVRPDYDIGELTLTSGSSDFTTSGSSLQTAAVQAGDAIIAPSGHVLIIASITGQNSGTLFLPCPAAAAGTSLPLRIRFQPDGSRYQGAVRNMIDLLSSGNIEAFAALVGAAGMVPIFTGVGTMDLADPATFGIQDPHGSLGKLAALTLAARQILQTDAAGDLKQVALAANKALATDASGDVVPIDLGTLGRALLALATGTSAQYVQGDGTLQAKAGLPVSTATQTALDGKLNTSGGQMSGSISFRMDVPTIQMRAPGGGVGYDVYANVSNTVNGGLNVRNVADSSVLLTIGGSTIGAYQVRVTGAMQVTGVLAKGSGTFVIDHPNDPYNRNLRHGFVEAPRYDLIYRGTVQLENGRAMVDIDAASNMTSGTFAALTTNADVYSVFNRTSPKKTVHATEIADGKFELVCLDDEQSTDRVTWLVIAERNDPFVKSDLDPNTDSDGRFVPEFEKEDA